MKYDVRSYSGPGELDDPYDRHQVLNKGSGVPGKKVKKRRHR